MTIMSLQFTYPYTIMILVYVSVHHHHPTSTVSSNVCTQPPSRPPSPDMSTAVSIYRRPLSCLQSSDMFTPSLFTVNHRLCHYLCFTIYSLRFCPQSFSPSPISSTVVFVSVFFHSRR